MFCFQPTYEELKLLPILLISLRIIKFSAYLRGIETQSEAGSRCGVAEFSAYLRGIETIDINTGRTTSHGFQPTYEELKPVDNDGSRKLQLAFSAYLRGIETQERGVEVSNVYDVFSLPTRN